MTTTIDCRGLACPQPVIKTRAAMRESETGEVVTLVDNETAAGNVSRMAEKAGWSVSVEHQDDVIRLYLRREAGALTESAPSRQDVAAGGATVLLVKSDRMGRGDDELGDILIRGFFHTLGELDRLPATIITVNSGVRLTTAGSAVLDDLRELEEKGVQILSCGTCLTHFGLADSLEVGEISNMYTIVETLMAAGKVVSP